MVRSQRGFTLIEVMTSLGVLSILVLIASVLSMWAVQRFMSVKERLLGEATAYAAEAQFRNAFGQALDVNFTTAAIAAAPAGPIGSVMHTTVAGTTASFEFDQMADSADWTRIALFYREQSPGLGATAQSSRGAAIPMTITYRRPTATTSGVIFFVNGVEGSAAALTPSYNRSFVDRITLFGISKRRHPSYDKTTSVDVHLKIRYHTHFGGGTNWCPQLDTAAGIAGCNQRAAWRDLERRFSVTLRDNFLKAANDFVSSAVSAEERTMGNLYFFRMLNPMER